MDNCLWLWNLISIFQFLQYKTMKEKQLLGFLSFLEREQSLYTTIQVFVLIHYFEALYDFEY
jgi:hypothetical protein